MDQFHSGCHEHASSRGHVQWSLSRQVRHQITFAPANEASIDPQGDPVPMQPNALSRPGPFAAGSDDLNSIIETPKESRDKFKYVEEAAEQFHRQASR